MECIAGESLALHSCCEPADTVRSIKSDGLSIHLATNSNVRPVGCDETRVKAKTPSGSELVTASLFAVWTVCPYG